MLKRDLIETLKDVDDNAQVVICQCLILDEKEEITAELHIPIVGTAYTKNDSNTAELRFILDLDSVKKCFHPKDVKFFPLEDMV